jgi:phosphoglycolate phosphatase
MTDLPSPVAIPPRIATVLFDLDGTLSDPKVGITAGIRRAMASVGRPLPPETDLDWCIGPPLRGIFLKLTGEDALVEPAVAAYRAWYGEIGLFQNTVYPEIPALLAGLAAAGLRLVLATSKPRDYAERILERFGLAEHFSAIHGAEFDGTRGVKTDLVPWILARERISRETAVMVGDREHDVFGARAAGIAAVGVAWGFAHDGELVAAGAAEIVESVASLGRLLRARITGSSADPGSQGFGVRT